LLYWYKRTNTEAQGKGGEEDARYSLYLLYWHGYSLYLLYSTELAKEVKKTQKSGHYETWHLKGILAEGACLHKVLTLLTLLVQKQEGTDCGWLLKPATDFTYFTGTKVGRY
jgi:hypothetical protein